MPLLIKGIGRSTSSILAPVAYLEAFVLSKIEKRALQYRKALLQASCSLKFDGKTA